MQSRLVIYKQYSEFSENPSTSALILNILTLWRRRTIFTEQLCTEQSTRQQAAQTMQLNLLTPILLQKYLQCGKGQRVILWKQSWRSYLRGDRQWLLRNQGRGGGHRGRQLLAQHQPWETKKPPVLRQRGLGLWQRVLVCQCVYCLVIVLRFMVNI